MYFQAVTELPQHAKYPGKTLTQEVDVLGVGLIPGQGSWHWFPMRSYTLWRSTEPLQKQPGCEQTQRLTKMNTAPVLHIQQVWNIYIPTGVSGCKTQTTALKCY